MTAVTLQFEDKFYTLLKQKADDIGYSVGNYILHVLTKNHHEADDATKPNDVDVLLESMQFHSGNVPVSEDGKGAVALNKFM